MKNVLLFALTLSLHSLNAYMPIPKLSCADMKIIGNKIWQNESGCSEKKLTWWNDGEEFASLGIGHCIWFPDHYNGPFTQTFPALLSFLQNHGTRLPHWLSPTAHCPWHTKNDFFAAFDSPHMQELRTLLANTVALQTQFIVERFINTIPHLLTHASDNHRDHIQQQLYRVAQSPMGMYALIDYTNFKGDGTNATERYNGHGWGLLQVLEHMHGSQTGIAALEQFAHSARAILATRVKNAPPERNETRWLAGWNNRIATYTHS